MKLYLIRHTQPAIESGICYGISDLDVADTFETEAKAIQSTLPSISPHTKVFSSPLIRCHQLAKFLAPIHPIAIDERLIEISFGDWELQPWRSIGRATLMKWKDSFVQIPAPNGEPFQSVFDRATAFYEAIRKDQHEEVWVVSHSGVIRALLTMLRQTRLEDAFNEQLGFGVVFEVDVKGKVVRLK